MAQKIHQRLADEFGDVSQQYANILAWDWRDEAVVTDINNYLDLARVWGSAANQGSRLLKSLGEQGLDIENTQFIGIIDTC